MTGLIIDHLSVNFGSAQPVRDVSIEIQSGRAVGVVGESGSGKSLTALAVMGLLPPQAQLAGEIRWRGRSLLSMTERQRRALRGREIAMIFQDPMTCLNPSYTVGFQIEEVLRYRLGVRLKAERIKRGLELLKSVGISAPESRWSAYPHQLSGGMSQRVAIAMALACEPDLLIADEPTTALDVTVQMQILELLFRLKKERGMSLLFVTHDLAVAGRVCDDILVMYAGQSMELGRADDLLHRPRHPYTQALMASRPQGANRSVVRSRLQTIQGSVPCATEKVTGCIFAPRCQRVFDRCTREAPVFSAQTQPLFRRCFLPV